MGLLTAEVLTEEQAEILRRSSIQMEARSHYAESQSYQARLIAGYRRNHHFAYPPETAWGSGDQWPGHSAKYPTKIHVNENAVRAFYLTEARLEAILPRITIPTAQLAKEDIRRAEAVEKVALTWLEFSGWDVWMGTLTQVKGLYGKGVLKPYWDDKNKRGDVYCLEQPHNLRVGWGRSDFTTMDWALYEMRMSPMEAERKFKIRLQPGKGRNDPYTLTAWSSSTDPLNQKSGPISQPLPVRGRHGILLGLLVARG